MTIDPRLNRLKTDYEKLKKLESQVPFVKITNVAEGDPPTQYTLQLACKGITHLSGGHPVFSEQHHLKITFPADYPRVQPELEILTPIFHPNFKGQQICLGQQKYSPNIELDNLVLVIIRMIRYEIFSEARADVLNKQALKWVKNNRDLIPLHIIKSKAEVEKTYIPLRPDFVVDYTALKPDYFRLKSKNGLFYKRLPKFQQKIKDVIKSNGGCLLVCGHMGVGKTSLINGVIGEFGDNENVRVVGIHLNLARPIESIRLKYKILERLNQEFPKVKELKFALERTKYQIKETRSDENSTSLESGVEGSNPKVSAKSDKKTVRSLERSLNPYDDIEAEQDIMTCLKIVELKYNTDPIWVRVWQSAFNVILKLRNRTRDFIFGTRLKIVVVLDELDKLDKEQTGQVSRLVESLKNIFTESNLSFILISGHETLDEFLAQQYADIEPIFRNMISYDEYIPCLWEEIRDIAYCAIDEERIPNDKEDWVRKDFLDYLVYMSRGNLRQFNRVLTTHKTGAVLEFDKVDAERITKIANLQRLVHQNVFVDSENQNLSPMEMDNQWLEAYRIIDYITNLQPGIELTVTENTFSHKNSWLHNHKGEILTQSVNFGVKLQTIIKIMEDLGYISIKEG